MAPFKERKSAEGLTITARGVNRNERFQERSTSRIILTKLIRDNVSTAFLLLALLGLVVLLVRLVAPYATPLAWACVLAAVFHPAYRLLLRTAPNRPGLCAAVMTVAVFALAVVPALVLSGVVAQEAINAYQSMAAFVTANRVQVLDDISHYWLVQPAWTWVQDRMAGGEVEPTALALSGLRWLSEFAAAHAGDVARNVFGFFIGIGILLFALFFALRDGAASIAYLEESLPMAAEDRRRIFARLQTTLLAVVQGLAATAVLQALLVGAGLWAVGIPFALLLGVLTFGLSFLPVGGAALVWIPAAIGLYITGDWVRATCLLTWGGLVVSSVDNLLRPLLIGGQAKLPTPLLFVGILGGLDTFGLVGLFAGPAVLAAFLSLMTIYRERLLSLGETPPGPSTP